MKTEMFKRIIIELYVVSVGYMRLVKFVYICYVYIYNYRYRTSNDLWLYKHNHGRS